MHLSDALKEWGFEVEEAQNGREALVVLERDGAKFDLVVSDIQMPELDGLGFLAEAKKRNLGVPVILNSNIPKFEDSAVLYGAVGFLQKKESLEGYREMVLKALRW
jgi:two-component system chemotaxis response regulator CheY